MKTAECEIVTLACAHRLFSAGFRSLLDAWTHVLRFCCEKKAKWMKTKSTVKWLCGIVFIFVFITFIIYACIFPDVFLSPGLMCPAIDKKWYFSNGCVCERVCIWINWNQYGFFTTQWYVHGMLVIKILNTSPTALQCTWRLLYSFIDAFRTKIIYKFSKVPSCLDETEKIHP